MPVDCVPTRIVPSCVHDTWDIALPLFRLRYGGSANSWGFAIHLASRNGYENTVLPTGYLVGTPEEALDCACGLYLNDPTAWDQPPTN
jgi:hypothetical protein